MVDRDITISNLEINIRWIEDNPQHQFPGWGNVTMAMRDAVELLKEQEAVEPILEQDSMVCGVCGHEVIWQKMLGDGIWADEELDYCPHCGRSVKWGQGRQ